MKLTQRPPSHFAVLASRIDHERRSREIKVHDAVERQAALTEIFGVFGRVVINFHSRIVRTK